MSGGKERPPQKPCSAPLPDHGGQSLEWLNQTVVGAGITSALGDFCYETSTVILPGFLAVLGIPAAALGIIEGVADAVASFMQIASGYVADKFGHRKLLVLIGYGMTPLGQVLLALAAGWPLLLVGRAISWFGKGMRGPLRDAIIIQSISAETRGHAFGFHRAMDTIGAILGPLLGVALLGWTQTLPWDDNAEPFRVILALSVIPGVLAVGAFLALVRDPQESANPTLKFLSVARRFPMRFKRYLGAVGLFGIGNFSHSLLILAATQLLSSSAGASKGVLEAAQIAGLLYVGRNIVQALASYPVGALADRIGSGPVLVAGYVCGAVTAMLMMGAFLSGTPSVAMLSAIFIVAGLGVAIEETVQSTLTAEMCDPSTLNIGYGAVGSMNGATKFASSTIVGLLWTLVSPIVAFASAAILMAAGTFALVQSIEPLGSQRA